MVDSRFRTKENNANENMMMDVWPYNFSKGDYKKRYAYYLDNSDINFENVSPALRPKMKDFDLLYNKIEKFKSKYKKANRRRQELDMEI